MSSPRPSYHHGNLRGELLTAAEQALAAGGVDSVSLRALAREIGVSHAAPGKHFSDRRALLDALALTGFERMRDTLVAAAEEAGGSAREQLAAIGRAYLSFALQNPALVALMYEHKSAADAPAELLTAGHEAMDISVAAVASGQARGEVVAGDPQRIALSAYATVHGIAVLAVGGLLGETEPEALITDALELLWTGLSARGGAVEQSQ